jgi:hypothetical protein
VKSTNGGVNQTHVKQMKDREDLCFTMNILALLRFVSATAVMPNGVPMAWHRRSTP